jgi:hypothetical protein
MPSSRPRRQRCCGALRPSIYVEPKGACQAEHRVAGTQRSCKEEAGRRSVGTAGAEGAKSWVGRRGFTRAVQFLGLAVTRYRRGSVMRRAPRWMMRPEL